MDEDIRRALENERWRQQWHAKRERRGRWMPPAIVVYIALIALIAVSVALWNEWLYDDWRCMFRECRILLDRGAK